jgi:pyruvate ferredoxin oxidoreductase gamma subunit
MRGFNCFSGLKDKGIAVINDKEGVATPKASATQKVYVVPANDIAMKYIGRPLGNTALIGAFAAASGELDLETLLEAIRHRFTGKAQEANLSAIKEGFQFIKNIGGK